jgi:NYN domain-containing protein/OST-HTH/LOTUS domain-containing protein
MKSRTNSKSDNDDDQPRLAVLIDADNAQPSAIEGLLAEVAKYGVASVKRIYGDFTSPRMTQWKAALLRHSISPAQQFAYTSGKNATDSSMIIDAMDLLYTQRFDGFCLVSSDSDFTRLAQRLREEGLTVYGFGEKKTPDAFVRACDKFVYTEVLRKEAAAGAPAKPPAARSAKKSTAKALPVAAKPMSAAPAAPATPPTPPAPVPTPEAKDRASEPLPLPLIRQAIEEASDENGWAFLGAVGSYLNKIRPDFDPRLYGHRKLSDLLKHQPRYFVVEERGVPGSSNRMIYVRDAG